MLAKAKMSSTTAATTTNPAVSVINSLMQFFSAFVNTKSSLYVQAALQAESVYFDNMLEELKASSGVTPTQTLPSLANTLNITSATTTEDEIPTAPKRLPSLSKFHLVLDIDGTLVHTVAKHEGGMFGEPDYEDLDLQLCSYKRPGLDKFMNFCFSHFQSVSLWTAGTQEYAEFIARSIAPPGYQFLFVLSRVHCKDHPSIEGTLVKDLNDLWHTDIATTFQINEENSLIVDDNDDYCYCNPQNSIIVKTWKYLHAADFTLPSLVSHFTHSDADSASSLCWGASL